MAGESHLFHHIRSSMSCRAIGERAGAQAADDPERDGKRQSQVGREQGATNRLTSITVAYHFWGATSHLNIPRRGGGRCSRTKLSVSLSCFATFSQ
jgi:hypothetical protein